MGMLAHLVEAGTTEVTLRLAHEVVIRGRLLTPSWHARGRRARHAQRFL